LGIGITRAIFQQEGKIDVVSIWLNKCKMNGAMAGSINLMNLIGIWSSPTEFDLTLSIAGTSSSIETFLKEKDELMFDE
jgi:hypothetical protein